MQLVSSDQWGVHPLRVCYKVMYLRARLKKKEPSFDGSFKTLYRTI